MIVPARGITGGMSIAVWNFGTSAGLSVPPGIWAMARSIQPACVATYHPIVDAPVSLRKFRRVSIIAPPVWAPLSPARKPARRCRSARDGSSMQLGIQALARARPDPSDHMATSPIGGPRAAGEEQPERMRKPPSRFPLGVGEPVMAGSRSRQPQRREARRLAPHGDPGGADREAGT